MKKLTKIIACFVLALFSIVGLSGCTVEEVKENTTTGVEASTNIIPVEYSQALARNMFTLTLANMAKASYSIEFELMTYDSYNYIADYFTDSFETYYLDSTHSTIFVDDITIDRIFNTDVDYSGKYCVAKLKDTTDNTEKYYTIYNLASEEEDPHIVKSYDDYSELVEEDIFPIDLVQVLPYVTSGMCYGDGFSYINAFDEASSISIKIKDGLIHEIIVLEFGTDVEQLYSYFSLKFNYDLPALNIPETVQELAAEGYVYGNPYSIIMDELGIYPPSPV